MADDQGKKLWSADEVLEVLESRNRKEYPLINASQVAELVGCSEPTARNRLEELIERDEVESYHINRGKAFCLANETIQPTEPAQSGRTQPPGDSEQEDDDEEPEIIADGVGRVQHILELMTIFGLVMGFASLLSPLVVFIFDLLTPLVFSENFLTNVDPAPARMIPEVPVAFFGLAIAAKFAIDLELIRQVELKLSEFHYFLNQGISDRNALVDLIDSLATSSGWAGLLLLLALFGQAMAYPGIGSTAPVPAVLLLIPGLMLGGLGVIVKVTILILKYRRAVKAPQVEYSSVRTE